MKGDRVVTPIGVIFPIAKDKRPGLCRVKFCRKACAKGRTLCHRHYMQAWRFRNPVSSSFASLRDRAVARGIDFKLSIDDFRTICKETGYDQRKGLTPESLSIDRVNPKGAYEISNIQVITFSENSSKGSRERRFLIRNRPIPWVDNSGVDVVTRELERRRAYVQIPAAVSTPPDEEDEPTWLQETSNEPF